MTPLDFFAGERHFCDHLWPIWEALPPERRGTFYAGSRRGADRYADELGMDVTRCATPPRDGRPIVVASYGNLKSCPGRPAALLEHGAGQQYGTANPGYSGGTDRGEVGLFLCPSETVAARNRERYPEAEYAVVGCPKLDRWHRSPLAYTEDDRPVVALAFHWPTPGPPEMGNAWEHFCSALREVRRSFPTVLGHGHPRFLGAIAPHYESAGIEVVRDFAEVLDRADVLAVDNSSVLYEFASTDRPVVLMNAPWYRRDVDFGLRFWDLATVGLQCDEPGALVDTIRLALADPPVVAAERSRCVSEVYGVLDGTGAQKAAAALCAWRPDPAKVRRRPSR